jgi:hypothetical protein
MGGVIFFLNFRLSMLSVKNLKGKGVIGNQR